MKKQKDLSLINCIATAMIACFMTVQTRKTTAQPGRCPSGRFLWYNKNNRKRENKGFLDAQHPGKASSTENQP